MNNTPEAEARWDRAVALFHTVVKEGDDWVAAIQNAARTSALILHDDAVEAFYSYVWWWFSKGIFLRSAVNDDAVSCPRPPRPA